MDIDTRFMSFEYPPDGAISTQDLREYFGVFQDAYVVHLDRERIRHGLWKDYPAEDQFNQIKIKIDRITRSLELIRRLEAEGDNEVKISSLKENIESESHDIINYATFGVRKLG